MTAIKKLNQQEYKDLLSQPVHLTDDYKPSMQEDDVAVYVEDALKAEGISQPKEALKAGAVYRSHDNSLEQVMYNYGVRDTFLVVICDLAKGSILGYFVLDFNEAL
ncbi:hypothetical protein RCC89_05930 [Cytophagaceae bacterium ABcell3]|nr:hypothetical protein RCC89_05930 [Cytophagaceae bacterium ABcell3]